MFIRQLFLPDNICNFKTMLNNNAENRQRSRLSCGLTARPGGGTFLHLRIKHGKSSAVVRTAPEARDRREPVMTATFQLHGQEFVA
jgi:hypothetical protein